MKNARIFDNLLALFLYKKDFAGFNKVVQTLYKKTKVGPTSMNFILLGYIMQNHLSDAAKLIIENRKLKHEDTDTWNLYLKTHLLRSDSKSFVKIEDHMQTNFIRPKYDLVFEFYSKKRNFEKVYLYMKDQLENQKIVNPIYFDLLITNLVEHKNFDRIDQIYSLLLDHEVNTISVYNRMLKLYFERKLTEKFEAIFDLCKKFRNQETFEYGIEWYCRVDNLEKVLNLVNSMNQKKIPKSPKIFLRVIRYFSKHGIHDRLQTLQSEIPEPYSMEIIECLMEYWAKRDLIQTISLYERIDGLEPPLSIMNLLLTCYTHFDLAQKVEKTVSLMPSPSIYTYTILTKYYFPRNLSKVEEIEATVASKGLGYTNLYMNTLLDGYSNLRQFDKVVRIFEEKRTVPDVYLYCTVMNAYFENKQFDQVFEMVQQMYKNKLQPNKAIYRVMIKTHIANGKPNKAKELEEKMSELK